MFYTTISFLLSLMYITTLFAMQDQDNSIKQRDTLFQSALTDLRKKRGVDMTIIPNGLDPIIHGEVVDWDATHHIAQTHLEGVYIYKTNQWIELVENSYKDHKRALVDLEFEKDSFDWSTHIGKKHPPFVHHTNTNTLLWAPYFDSYLDTPYIYFVNSYNEKHTLKIDLLNIQSCTYSNDGTYYAVFGTIPYESPTFFTLNNYGITVFKKNAHNSLDKIKSYTLDIDNKNKPYFPYRFYIANNGSLHIIAMKKEGEGLQVMISPEHCSYSYPCFIDCSDSNNMCTKQLGIVQRFPLLRDKLLSSKPTIQCTDPRLVSIVTGLRNILPSELIKNILYHLLCIDDNVSKKTTGIYGSDAEILPQDQKNALTVLAIAAEDIIKPWSDLKKILDGYDKKTIADAITYGKEWQEKPLPKQGSGDSYILSNEIEKYYREKFGLPEEF